MRFKFLRKKAKRHIDATSPGADPGVCERLAEISDRLRKLENRQKETSLQIEGIDDFLQSGSKETALINTLIALVDVIGDFYYFAAAADSPLFEQAQMMWNTAINAVEAAGLEMIETGNEPFDFRLHSAECVEQDYGMPNGHVIKTLKCGYIYRDEVIRRAAVVVNKIDTQFS